MTQKKKKKSVASNPHGNLANSEQKKSNGNTKKANLFGQNISSTEAKKKSALPPNHQISNTEQQMDMDIVDQAIGIHFQEEIIMDILSRLPVRSLLRFKCVSKCWKTLISDPYFKMKHLSHAKNDQNSQKLLVSQRIFDKFGINAFRCSLSSVQLVEDVQKLDCPLNCKMRGSRVFCCCDGLFLIGNINKLNVRLLLWNPSTRESIVLPFPEFPLHECIIWGLGYDEANDDYKILKIDANLIDGYKLPYEVLSLKSGSWRKIGKHPTGIVPAWSCTDPVKDPLAFVRGAFHWLGLAKNFTIVSFSVSNEVFREIPLLDKMWYAFDLVYVHRGLVVLGGMLCYFSTYNHDGEGVFKLMVMKDYGVKESWTTLFTIRENNLFTVRPSYRFANDEVLLCCRRFGHFGSVFRTTKGPFGSWPQPYHIFQQGFMYTESLISPKLIT